MKADVSLAPGWMAFATMLFGELVGYLRLI